MTDMPDIQRALPQLRGAGFYVRALSTLGRRGDGAIPRTTARFSAGPLESRHVSRYVSELEFSPDLGIPLTYYYLLAQRAQLGLMLARGFPFPVMGMVHVANELRGVQPPNLSIPFVLDSRVRDDSTSDSGARYVTLEVIFYQDGEPIVTCCSKYLARRGKGAKSKGSDSVVAMPFSGEVLGQYRLVEASGRRYAALSGDANPIHMWPWSARLLGFKQPIIHGMHTLARVVALVQRCTGSRVVSVDASFLKPICIPADVEVHCRGDQFEVWSGAVRAVVGVTRVGDAWAATKSASR